MFNATGKVHFVFRGCRQTCKKRKDWHERTFCLEKLAQKCVEMQEIGIKMPMKYA